MKQTQQTEPPSWFRPPVFMVGQNSRGNWVAREQKGVCGGLFVSREAALPSSAQRTDTDHKRWSWFRGISNWT